MRALRPNRTNSLTLLLGFALAAPVSPIRAQWPADDIMLVPVEVVGRHAAAMRLDASLDYVSGVSRQNNFGGAWDNLAVRGFAGHEDSGMSLLRNGFSSNRGFNAPRENFFGDPNDGDRAQANHTHQITLEHALSARWRGRLDLASKRSTLEGTASEVRPFVNVTGDSVNLRRRYVDFASDDVTVQANF